MPSVFKSVSKAFKSSSSKPPLESSKSVPSANAGLHDAGELHAATLHQDAHEEGGLACNNDDLLKEQREAITQWITSMGKKIFTGNFNLISTPFPVRMFEPRSYLEKLADVWVYPRYLHQASLCQDPVERMKLVVTWFVAGLHHGFEKWKKPFNPILGETWQACLSDGSRMFMEQISHHPPVTAFHLDGPGGSYTFTGLSQPNVSIVLKYYGFKTMAKGFRHLDFADGSRIDIHYPGYYIKGVVYSTRPRAEVDGSAIFTDLKNGIRAVLRFGPNKGARAPVLRRSDAVIGEIYEVPVETAWQAVGPPSEEKVLCEESSSELVASTVVRAADNDSEFETASESDWELREVRDVGERERDTDSPVESTHHQRSLSQHRVLSDAANILAEAELAAIATVATPLDDTTRSTDAPYLYSGPGSQHSGTDRSSAPIRQPPPQHTSDATSLLCSATTVHGPTGKKSFSKELRVSDTGSKSEAKLAEQPSSSGLLSGFSRMMGIRSGSAPPSTQPDLGDTPGKLLARLEGSWLSHINIDGKRYWTWATERPDSWRPVEHALPSDSRFRKDLVMVKQGDVNAAQVSKEELEQLQRRDKKLRESGGARTYHP